MGNVEHLFENALVALKNHYDFGDWLRIEKDRHNTDGVSDEVIEVIWELAIYTKYSYEPAVISRNAIPTEWMKDWWAKHIKNAYDSDTVTVWRMLEDWWMQNINVVFFKDSWEKYKAFERWMKEKED